MLIASKFEEIFSPEVKDFVFISDSAYSKDDILLMEHDILRALDFQISTPSPLHFLRRYSKAAGSDLTTHTLCKYLIEVSLLDTRMLKFRRSLIAASSVYLARCMLDVQPLWTPTLEHYSQFEENEVRLCANELNFVLKSIKETTYKSLENKYSGVKGEVSLIPSVGFF